MLLPRRGEGSLARAMEHDSPSLLFYTVTPTATVSRHLLVGLIREDWA